MKKEIILIIFLIIITPTILSLDITIKKKIYEPRETLQLEFTGNFISISLDNILIYRKGMAHSEPVISGLTKQDNVYYFYAILPNYEGNYTLKIEGAEYTDNGVFKNNPIEIDFEIKRTENSALSLNPGFIVADKNIILEITSLNKNALVSASLQGSNQKYNFTLIEDNSKKIEFSAVNLSGKKILKVNNYEIPVFILNYSRQDSSNENIPYIVQPHKNPDLIFVPEILKATIVSGETYYFNIYIENKGKDEIENINLSTNFNSQISPNYIYSLKPREKLFINLTIPIPNSIKNNFSGNLLAQYESNFSVLPIYFTITKNISNLNLNETSTTVTSSCYNIGNLCAFNEYCSGLTTASLEGPCCIGECIEKKKSQSSIWWGILILIFVIAVLGFLIWKGKQKQRSLKSAETILKERANKNQTIKSDEVKGNLENI